MGHTMILFGQVKEDPYNGLSLLAFRLTRSESKIARGAGSALEETMLRFADYFVGHEQAN